ncbi:alpha/beta hydrolase [Halovivax cerinus]|uniref:Alpha/beta hydrolase n=1 Tax=Halovivax cerinus TaxID=1487865 RepID=A0ABD5NM48_9EURY|nr:alpha/beta hydrolase [Halovivax cerinus]
MSPAIDEREIRFKRTPQRDLFATAYLPPDGDRIETTIVLLHGGVWNRGERTFFDERGRALAERGMQAVTVDYRLSGEATYPAALKDVKSAVRWLKSDPPANRYPNTLVLCGHSAGAHLAALTAAAPTDTPVPDDGFGETSSAVDGLIGFAGPYDLLGARQDGETAAFMGGPPSAIPEQYRNASPRERVTQAHPPARLYHGTEDQWLTLRETRAYRDTLRLAGVDVELRTPPGDHFFFQESPWFERTLDQTVSFVTELGPNAADSTGESGPEPE